MRCATCGEPFEPRRMDHRFCSPKCRLVWFLRKPEQARRDRDAQIRLLLKTELDTNQLRNKEDAEHVRRRLREVLVLLEPDKTEPL